MSISYKLNTLTTELCSTQRLSNTLPVDVQIHVSYTHIQKVLLKTLWQCNRLQMILPYLHSN